MAKVIGRIDDTSRLRDACEAMKDAYNLLDGTACPIDDPKEWHRDVKRRLLAGEAALGKAVAHAEEEIEAERALMRAAVEMLDGMAEDDEKGVPF